MSNPVQISNRSRLAPIDGLRTIAVLGVLWAHIWMFMGNPAFRVAGINLAPLPGVFGTGVDLFFVISGFVMYLMYASRQTDFSFASYMGYIWKRVKRIVPAYYVAVFVYALYAVGGDVFRIDPVYMLQNLFFIRTWVPGPTQYAPHFWSLCTEWHFYLVLPLMVWILQKWKPSHVFAGLLIFCILFRAFLWNTPADPFELKNYFILNRLIEFLMGIIACSIFLHNYKNRFTASATGLILGFGIMLFGRLLLTGFCMDRPDVFGWFARVFNLPILTLGYAMILINVLQCKTAINRFLENKWIQKMGKYSYSMYLWHWMIAELMVRYLGKSTGLHSFLMVNIIFILSILLLYPLSAFSYRLLESYYFNRTKTKATVQNMVNT